MEILPHAPTMQRKRVLVVDPDPVDRETARKSLDLPDLEICGVASIRDALEESHRQRPDVVLSELALADGSGFALCRSIRESEALASVPIMLVSRWAREADRILGFECGADDFVAKPYFARELVSRLRAVLRRSAQLTAAADERPLAARDGLVVDAHRRAAWVEGEVVPLTPREFALLETLALSGGRVLTRTDLIREAWKGPGGLHERSVDAHIKSLRRKLGSARDAVETVRGLGYRFADEDRPAPQQPCPTPQAPATRAAGAAGGSGRER